MLRDYAREGYCKLALVPWTKEKKKNEMSSERIWTSFMKDLTLWCDSEKSPKVHVLQAWSIVGNVILSCESFGVEVSWKRMTGGGPA